RAVSPLHERFLPARARNDAVALQAGPGFAAHAELITELLLAGQLVADTHVARAATGRQLADLEAQMLRCAKTLLMSVGSRIAYAGRLCFHRPPNNNLVLLATPTPQHRAVASRTLPSPRHVCGARIRHLRILPPIVSTRARAALCCPYLSYI